MSLMLSLLNVKYKSQSKKLFKIPIFVNGIILLTVTAMPGFQKLIPLLILKVNFGFADIDRFTSDNFLVFILSSFTAYSWGSILLTDIQLQEDKTKFFQTVNIYSILTTLLSIPIVYLLDYFGFVYNALSCSVLLLGWSIFQLWRHFMLSIEKRRELLIGDIFYLISFSIFILFFPRLSIIEINLIQAVICILIPLLYFFYFVEGKVFFKIKTPLNGIYTNRIFWNRANSLAWLNFSTGVIPLFIAPLAYKLLPTGYSTGLGLISNIAAFFLLLPRSLSFYFFPKLSRMHINSSVAFPNAYEKYLKSIRLLVLILSLIVLILWFISDDYFDYKNLPGLYFLFPLIILTALFTQFLLPISNKLMILKQENVLLTANIISLSIFIVLLGFVFYFIKDVLIVFYFFCFLQMIFTLMRGIIIRTIYLKRLSSL